jgi:hypothetical protein
MPTDLQKLAKAMAAIKKRHPAGSGRYSTIVENPFESGYWPLSKPKRADLSIARKLRKQGQVPATASSR